MDDIIYKRLAYDLIPDVKKLFYKVYGKHRSLEYFQKKYDPFLNEGRYLGFLAYNTSGDAIGFSGVCFYKILHKDKIYTAGQIVDAMGDKKYAKKMIYSKLATMNKDAAKLDNIDFLYGFGTRATAAFHIKRLKWQFTEKMNCYVVEVRTLPIYGIFAKLKMGKIYNIYLSLILKMYKKGNFDFISGISQLGFGGGVRDKQFFNYKNYDEKHMLEIDGSRVWIKVDGSLKIGDMELSTKDQFDIIMDTLKVLARLLGVKNIIFQISKNIILDNFLSQNYTQIDSYEVFFYNYKTDINFKEIKFTYGDIDIF